MEAAIQKEMRDHAALVRSTIGGLSTQLDHKFKAIKSMQVCMCVFVYCEYMCDHAALVRSTIGGLSTQLDHKFEAIKSIHVCVYFHTFCLYVCVKVCALAA